MRAQVFTDRALMKTAGQFAWLAVDMDNARNAPFFASHRIESVPEYLVIDPLSEKLLAAHVGSLTVDELLQFLDEARRRFDGTLSDPALVAFQSGTTLLAQGDAKAAAVALQSGLDLAAASADRAAWKPRIAVSLAEALMEDQQYERCVDVAEQQSEGAGHTVQFQRLARFGANCALQLKDGHDRARHFVERLVRSAQDDALLPIDRSYGYGDAVTFDQILGDPEGAKKQAGSWAAYLESAIESADFAGPRAALANELARAAIAAGEPARAVAPLERTVSEQPNSYASIGRLAQLYAATKQWEKGLALLNAAQGAGGYHAYALTLRRFDLQFGKGDLAGAKSSLERARSLIAELPATRDRAAAGSQVDGLSKKLEEASAPTLRK